MAEHHDPAAVAEQIRQRYWDDEYDFATDWPVRMAVIRQLGVPTHRVWVSVTWRPTGPVSRSSWPSWRTGQPQAPVRAAPPRAHLAALGPPAPRRPRPPLPGSQRSPPTALLERQLYLPGHVPGGTRDQRPHRRRGVAGAAGAVAVALARVTGVDPVVTRVVVSNRFRPALARTASPIVHNGLCVVDVAGITVDEAVQRTQHRAMTAYKYAYYDPDRLAELVARVGRERGEEVDIGCFFNDRRLRDREQPGPAPTPQQIRDALPLRSFQWNERQGDEGYDPLFLNIDDHADGIAISVFVDTHRFSPGGAEACVRGMEAAAVAAAFDPAVPTQVAPGT